MSKYNEVTGVEKQVTSFLRGQTMAGSHMWWLEAVQGFEDEDGGFPDEPIAGFFHSQNEAEEYAVKHGWTLIK